MRYVRVDESQICPMMVSYYLYPLYEGENEFDFNLKGLFNRSFETYEEAATMAMLIVKDPNNCIKFYNENSPIKLEYDDIKKINDIIEIDIFQELIILDENFNCIDCPEEYVFHVGTVSKEDDSVDKSMMS